MPNENRITSSDPFLAVIVTAAIILCVTVWLGLEIRRGVLIHDELLTGERSREMLLMHTWSVPFDFKIAFDKPPLQYWLTTLTLPRFRNPNLAVRVWPLLFGIFTLGGLGWLAYVVDPDRPWLMPLSVIALSACPFFSLEASRALLDTGLTLFTTWAIVFSQLARKKPVWWLATACCCALGTLQKIPLIPIVWMFILLLRVSSRYERATLGSAWLGLSVVLAVALTAIWPTIQVARHGMPVNELFGINEFVSQLTGSSGAETDPYSRLYVRPPAHLRVPGWLGALALFATATALLFNRTANSKPALREIAILCLFFIGVAVLFSFRSVRYVMPVLPCLCLLLAFGLYRLCEKPEQATRVTGILLMAVLFGSGFTVTKFVIGRRIENVSDEKRAAEALGRLQQQGVTTVLVNAQPEGNALFYDSFFLFHGNLKFPTTRYTADQLRRDPPPRPLVGVCALEDFSAVRGVYADVQLEFAQGNLRCWQVPSAGSEP